MSATVIERLCAERDQARDAAIAMAEGDEFNPEDKAFQELQTRASELDRQIGNLADLIDKRAAADVLDGKMSKAQRRTDTATTQVRETLGEAFIRSDVFSSYPGRGTSPRFTTDDVNVQTRALPMNLAGWADALPPFPVYDLTPPEPQAIILPLITQIQVSQNAVEYITYSKTSGGAAKVAEGAAKPPAEWAPNVTSATLDNLAVYTQMTRQLMEDASAVRSYIDQELRREVLRKAESEAVAAVSGAAVGSAAGPAGSGVLGAIRAAMAEVENAGYRPNAFLISSDDLINADLQVMNTAGTGPDRRNAFWGLTPVVDPAAVNGTVLVGDFRAGVQHYTRSAVSLYITDSHADTFLSNVFTLLAEQRSKTVVTRPACLSKGTVTAGP